MHRTAFYFYLAKSSNAPSSERRLRTTGETLDVLTKALSGLQLD